MKNIGILMAMMLMTALSSNIQAQKVRTLTNGLSINLITGFPSSTFGTENSSDYPSEMQYGALFGIKLGNRWYFSPKEQYGFGLMVNWIDFAMAVKTKSEKGGDIGRTTMDITFFGLGPIGTYAINDEMAIDSYYNLRPTLLISGDVRSIPNESSDHITAYAGFGFSHAIGAAFRYKVLNIGLEYVMGGINTKGQSTEPNLIGGGTTTNDLPDAKLSVNSVRIILGVKF